MTGGRAIALVARRELVERLRSRAFRASTGIMLIVIVGVVAFGALTDDGGPDTVRLGAAGAEGRAIAEAARAGAAGSGVRFEVERLGGAGAARAAVRDGDVDLAVTGDRVLTGDADDADVALVQAAARDLRTRERLLARGLEPAQVERALDPPPLAVAAVDRGDEEAGAGIAAIASLLLYFMLISFGYYIAGGVVEEKSSRVVELVLAAIRPLDLLAGKVVGIGLLGLGQVVVVGGVGLGAALASGAVDLPGTTVAAAVLTAVWFVLGYLLYAFVFAAAASLVSRQEDLQSTTGPPMVVLIVGYLASLSALGDPDSTAAVVCTYLPPVAPMVVPARAAQDALGGGELALSLALTIAMIAAVAVLAARIYERTVLRTGAPLRLTQAVRFARARA